MNKRKYIIGLDGGGSKTHAVLFDSNGVLIADAKTSGTNLAFYKDEGIERIINVLFDLCNIAKISLDEISAIGIGVAGISEDNQRDSLLRELDRNNLANKTLLLSDIEGAFKILCPSNIGVLVIVGTGVVCFGRNDKNKTVRYAGEGHENGDIGSGYWIGKQAIKHLVINESIISIDEDLSEISSEITKVLKIKNINEISNIAQSNESLFKISSIAKSIIALAEKGNDLSLSIIQEGTIAVADYIVSTYNELGFDRKEVIISCVGSVVKNKFYRKVLNDALQFEFHNIHWVFSDLPISFGAGLIASQAKNINISVNNIAKNNL